MIEEPREIFVEHNAQLFPFGHVRLELGGRILPSEIWRCFSQGEYERQQAEDERHQAEAHAFPDGVDYAEGGKERISRYHGHAEEDDRSNVDIHGTPMPVITLGD